MKEIIKASLLLMVILLLTTSCVDNNAILIQKGEYYQAYINYCEQSNEEKTDECLLLWEKSILAKEEIDENYKNVSFFSKNNREVYWNNIKQYLYSKTVPNNEESELIIYLIDNCSEVYTYVHEANFTSRTLKKLMSEEKIWLVTSWQSLSYEDYYSKERYYNQDSKNTMYSINKELAYFEGDIDGYKVVVSCQENFQTKYKEQYIICGDYSEYNNGFTFDDGYWHYFLLESEIVRLSYKGKKEVIYSLSENEKIRDFIVLEHDIAYYLVEKDNKLVFYRTYLPEMKTEMFVNVIVDDRLQSWTNLLIPKSNYYISYVGYEPKFFEITEQLKDDIDKCYLLYEKYGIVLTDEMKIKMVNSLNDPENADIYYRSVILKEYGVDKYAKYEYNINSKETVVSSYETESGYEHGESLY